MKKKNNIKTAAIINNLINFVAKMNLYLDLRHALIVIHQYVGYNDGQMSQNNTAVGTDTFWSVNSHMFYILE